MARSRRGGKRRMRADWVYRGEEFNATGQVHPTQVASYTGAIDRANGAYTLTVGAPLGLVLYDSNDYLRQGTRTIQAVGGNVTMGWMGKEGRAEGKRPTILGVDVHLELQPSAWTLGANWALGWRLVICDQNMSTGGLDLPGQYKMSSINARDNGSSMWANGWGNLMEGYRYVAFMTGNETVRWSIHARWRGRRTLSSSTCLGLYVESAPPAALSTTLRVTPMCRSLVHDPNA